MSEEMVCTPSNESENDNCTYVELPTILDLPVEILINIFENVNTKDLLKNVRLVCKHFLKILDDSFFRNRIKYYFKATGIPPVTELLGLKDNCSWKPGSRVSWKSMCYHLQVEGEIWKTIEENGIEHSLLNVYNMPFHSACVDTVKIFNKGRLAVSGARDRCLNLWNIEDVPYSLGYDRKHHGGWIWDLECIEDDIFFSCDWNGDACMWSVSRQLDPISKYSLGKPILCIAAVPDYYVVGLQTKEICFLDPRISTCSSKFFMKIHRAAVMDIAVEGPYVVTVSEDKTFAVTDVRKLKKVKSFQISATSPPISISKVCNLLYIADTSGCIKVVDTSVDFEVCMTLQNFEGRLTSICAKPGILWSASRNHYVTVSTISDPMILRANICMDSEIACVDYSHSVLAAARADNMISFFNTRSFH